jgi:signal transduction histidine kinase/ligand-binding sensor domain-containing protein
MMLVPFGCLTELRRFGRRLGWWWLLVVCLATPMRAQYRFDHWTADNGLPQNSVRDIVQTQDGYLWLATFDGLVRFDGVRFTIFNKSNSPGIISNRFFKLYEDVTGDLWALTEDGARIRLRQGGFTTYSKEQSVSEEIAKILSFDKNWIESPAKKQQLVAGRQPWQTLTIAADGALWLTDPESGKQHPLTTKPVDGLEIVVAYADREGNYWFGTSRNGLFRARRQTVTAYGSAQGLTAAEVYPLLEDRAGTIWLGSAAEGLFRFQNGAFTKAADPHPLHPPNTSLFEDRAGRVWSSGWMQLREGRFVGNPYYLSSISPGFCWTMYEDRDGAMWYGTIGGVIRDLNGAPTHFTTQDGLAGDDTKVIIGDVRDHTEKSLWLGSYGGLTHFKDGRFTKWTEQDGLPGNTVRALKQDGDGTLWIGTYDSGLGRFRDGQFTRYTMKDGLFDNGVFQMLEDDFGWLWMSCNRGIYRVRKQELNDFADGKTKAIVSVAFGKSDGLDNVECNGGRWPAGIKARDGKLWFPTMGGVAVIDPATVTTNAQPPPVVIEDMRINNQAVSSEAWQSAIRNPQSAISILPGQENFEIEYTALSFINSGNLRFKYKLEGADAEWVEAGTRRTAYFSHLAPGAYTFRVIAANADGVWNQAGARLRIQIVPPFYRTWWFVTLALLALFGAVFGGFRYRVKQLEERQAAQQAFARQMIESQEAERKRIAAELHDSLGQHLVVIKNLALMWLQRHTDDEAQPIHDISATTSQAISEVKEISYNLRPYQLDRIGLAKAIEALLKKAEAASGIQFTTAIDDLQDALPKESEINFYRIVQECVNNILKHSQATEAIVTIRRRGPTLQMMIQDNGKGFTPSGAASDKHGFGLLGINERAQLLGGQAVIQSAPHQGTTTTLELVLMPGDTGDKDEQ